MKNGIYNIGPQGMRALMGQFEINCGFVELDSYEDIFRVLDEGAADAGVVNRIFGRRACGRYNITETPLLVSPISIHFILSPATPALRI
jgi:hypothetical protein